MIFEAVIAAGAVALTSVVGALFFGNKGLVGAQRYVVPMAVGVFLSLVLFELIPETLALSPEWGGIAVAFGFISFYVLASVLHKRYHHLEAEDCDRKGAAALLLIGMRCITPQMVSFSVVHFYLIQRLVWQRRLDSLHEIPQEIVEFGVFIRAGYTRTEAVVRNLLSASTIILGTVGTLALAEHAAEFMWILTGVAAGNLLFLAASDLLPRIHGNLKNYGSIWNSTASIVLGFVLMTVVLVVTHETFGHGHEHDHEHDEMEHADEH
ncbi:MAG: ZIP family metal transporter [Candidatus Paceibacterota bacterium]